MRAALEDVGDARNRLGTSVDWRFTTEDACIKLRKLYPSVEEPGV